MEGCLNIRMPKFFCLIILLLSLLQSKVLPQNKQEKDLLLSAYPPVPVPNTEFRTFRSQLMNQDFNIYIRLPWNYYTDSTTTYPVMFLTDANRSFPFIADLLNVLTFPNTDVSDIVLIGIGYKIRNMADWAVWRTRDLTPTNNKGTDNYWETMLTKMTGQHYEVKSGGASKFLEFIIQELIPFIESQYRVSHSDRGLGGYSYGGLFSLYAFFRYPETFTHYFAGSPSIDHDNGSLFKYENEFAFSHKEIKVNIFMSVGNMEDSTTILNIKRMINELDSLNNPGIELQMQIFDGEDHRSCMAAAYTRAFRILYKK
jgi:predicted alpha/beta superfamily hydrolase